MPEQEFLAHRQLTRNSFAFEEAQTTLFSVNSVFPSLFIPGWGKVQRDAGQIATAVVFGPKGSGKSILPLDLPIKSKHKG